MIPDRALFTSRHRGIADSHLLMHPVTVIGIGGIGSTLLPLLARLGFSTMTLIDPDTVDAENIGSQWYRTGDIGKQKVVAAQELLGEFFPHLAGMIRTVPAAYAGEPLDGIVLTGVDTMAARSTIWQAVRFNSRVPLYVDGRTAGEELHVYAIRPTFPEEVLFYERSLVPDTDTVVLPCTEHAAPHTHAVIAGFMTNMLIRWIRGDAFPRQTILFLQTFHLDTLF